MRLLKTSLVIALLTACGLAAQVALAETTATDKPDPDPARFTADIAAFEAWDRQNSAPKDAAMFVGSSSIRMWQTAESFPNLAVINRGFGGSHVSDVNHFAERIVLKYHPRTIVFYAGDNDVADGKSPEQVVEDFAEFVEFVRAQLPDASILYLPIKPSLARWQLWPTMQQANSLVQRYAEGDAQVKYVDTATPMLGSDGKPRPEIFSNDGLHMNDAGYRLWTEILNRELGR